jgi:hypothetical protein
MMRRVVLGCAVVVAAACHGNPPHPSAPVASLPGHGELVEDVAPKQGPRLLPAEAYVRSYLMLFGGLSPLAVAAAARGTDGNALFDTWNAYLNSLGMPDHRLDVSRPKQTSTLMLATLERTGVALCDRAVQFDLQGATPVAQRRVFAFDLPPGGLDLAAFAPRFDILHRTFLGYPARLAPGGRVDRFFEMYSDIVARHAASGAAPSRFTPAQAGWATVCYALVRHPEFNLY